MESSAVRKSAKESQSLKALLLSCRFSAAPPRKPKVGHSRDMQPFSCHTCDILMTLLKEALAPGLPEAKISYYTGFAYSRYRDRFRSRAVVVAENQQDHKQTSSIP